MILYLCLDASSIPNSLFPKNDGEGGSENGGFSIDYYFVSATFHFRCQNFVLILAL